MNKTFVMDSILSENSMQSINEVSSSDIYSPTKTDNSVNKSNCNYSQSEPSKPTGLVAPPPPPPPLPPVNLFSSQVIW